MVITFLDIFILTALLQGVFMGTSLIISRFLKSKPNKYLGLTIITLTFLTFLGWQSSDAPILKILLSIRWDFLFPVFLFHYFILYLNHRFKDKSWTKFLYLPFCISLIIHLVLEVGFIFKFLSFDSSSFGFKVFKGIEYNLSFFYGLFLMIWSARLIWTDRNIQHENEKWIKRMSILTFLFYFLWFLVDNLANRLNYDFWMALWVGLSCAFLGVIYFGVYRMQLLNQKEELSKIFKKQKNLGEQESKTPSNTDKHFNELEKLMLEDKLYRNPDLSRDDVAEKLGISSGYLSQVLKNASEKNFSDYINNYRVQAAKQMLSNPSFDKFSIQAIGTEAGFKSRSAFYNSFQKAIGQSPGKFKKG
ncbi:helix-turn-helix transcriptional regulator [Chondrinema litorale]|uniref:helix-turn-helix transcriptional regulator n=1 Tax=Chondrinema litorale TaxID=2994555 RepID=UPI002543A11A|nr:helix-turn-helix transcriptional regulator [Chondrinema litorale]UZR96428.1 helix-turn-helix transcriptional regulator [Chondrinema litorale]